MWLYFMEGGLRYGFTSYLFMDSFESCICISAIKTLFSLAFIQSAFSLSSSLSIRYQKQSYLNLKPCVLDDSFINLPLRFSYGFRKPSCKAAVTQTHRHSQSAWRYGCHHLSSWRHRLLRTHLHLTCLHEEWLKRDIYSLTLKWSESVPAGASITTGFPQVPWTVSLKVAGRALSSQHMASHWIKHSSQHAVICCTGCLSVIVHVEFFS